MTWLSRIVEAIVRAALDLATALVRGILRAPLTAAERAALPVDVDRALPGDVVDLRHRVLRQGRPRQDAVFDGDHEPDTRHFTARHDGRVIAVASVMRRPGPRDTALQLRGMAVAPEWRGRGVGRALLHAVEADVAAPMWCNARESAVPFYARHGWQVVGEPFSIEGVGPHRRMVFVP